MGALFMYDEFPFYTYRVPGAVTPAVIQNVMTAAGGTVINGKCWDDNSKDSIRTTLSEAQLMDYRITGRVKEFRTPPISPYALEHLTHLQCFNLFYAEDGFLTKRQNFHKLFILYTYEGYGVLEYQGKKYHLGPGDGFFIDGEPLHMFRSSGKIWVHGILEIEGPNLRNLYSAFAQNGNYVFSESDALPFREIVEKLLRTYSAGQPYRDWQAAVLLDGLLTRLLSASLLQDRSNLTILSSMPRIIQYVENNFTQELSMEQLSRHFGISKSHLSREFKKYTGISPMDYVIQMRLAHAARRLIVTDEKSSVIAEKCGFNNVNNFIKLFKKKYAMTPRQYRANMGLAIGERSKV